MNNVKDRFKPRLIAKDIAGRTPPHDDLAERSVISAVLTEPRALDAALEHLPSGEAFYVDAHRRIYDAAIELRERGQPIDIATVGSLLRDRERLQAIGGVAYLSEVSTAAPYLANCGGYARIVADKYRVRRLIETCQMYAAEGHSDYGDANDFVARASSEIASVAESNVRTRIASVAEIARSRDAEIEEQWNGKREAWGMRGSFPRLHALSHGYGLGEQTYLASDTGGGKSVYAMQEVRAIAGRTYNGERIGAGVLSLEMESKDHYDRAIVQETHALARAEQVPVHGVTLSELMTGRVHGLKNGDSLRAPETDEGRAKQWLITEARRRMRDKPIEFDDAPKDTALVRVAARAMQRRLRERGAVLRLLVIDHMHIMRFPDERREDIAIAKMVGDFNDLAKELGLHLLVLAQYGRGRVARGDRPIASDLRGAAAIEQIAHKVFLVYRPFVLLEDKSKATEEEKREAEVIVAKHRKGKQGAIPMSFDGAAFTFTEVENQEDTES